MLGDLRHVPPTSLEPGRADLPAAGSPPPITLPARRQRRSLQTHHSRPPQGHAGHLRACAEFPRTSPHLFVLHRLIVLGDVGVRLVKQIAGRLDPELLQRLAQLELDCAVAFAAGLPATEAEVISGRQWCRSLVAPIGHQEHRIRKPTFELRIVRELLEQIRVILE